jgi:undecaprenyl-diphosphatase
MQDTIATAQQTKAYPSVKRELWSGLAFLAIFIILFLSVLKNANSPWFVGLDQAWHTWVVSLRTPPLNTVEIAVDTATGGPIGGSLLMLVPVVVLLVLRRWWAALFYGVGTLACGFLGQIAKQLVARDRPTDHLWHVDFGSFPSGHLTGFTFFIVALCLLIKRRWMTVVGIVLLLHEIFNRTYLAAHWLTDTFAGLALGAAGAFLLWAAFAKLISRQPRPRAPKTTSSVS